jgi:hypothetical protein
LRQGRRDFPPLVRDHVFAVGGDEATAPAQSMDRLRAPSVDLRPSSDRRPTRNPRNALATASDVFEMSFFALASSFANRCGVIPRWP